MKLGRFNRKHGMLGLFGLGGVVVASLFAVSHVTPSTLDPFATCLGEKGATFYGAFWCGHCQEQKQMFGAAKSKLPYVECASPDGQRQLDVCVEAKVESYPTWVFSDGERRTGVQTLAQLAEKTGCTLPL